MKKVSLYLFIVILASSIVTAFPSGTTTSEVNVNPSASKRVAKAKRTSTQKHVSSFIPFEEDPLLGTLDTVPLKDHIGNIINNKLTNPYDLDDPKTIKKETEYDVKTGSYILTEKIGDEYYTAPTNMTFQEYLKQKAKKQESDYFNKLSGINNGEKGITSAVDPIGKIDIQKNMVDRLFGGQGVTITPNGNIDLTFGVKHTNIANPTLLPRQRKFTAFDFDMNIKMDVSGKIGEKLNLSTQWNNNASFNFDNQMKLKYDTKQFSEDEIIKDIGAGNVSFTTKGSLIQGVSSLFGLRTELLFGKLRISSVAAIQQSKRNNLQIQNGAQIQKFSIPADRYDENKHFFLSHYNRATFEEGVKDLPYINSLFQVLSVDVWVTNSRNETQNVRDIIALSDLGEPQRFNDPTRKPLSSPKYLALDGITGLPDNEANDLFETISKDPLVRQAKTAVATLKGKYKLEQGRDFEKIQARKLSPQEYTFDPKLGYVSLNVNLRPGDVCAVNYTYKYNGQLPNLVGDDPQNAPRNGESVDSTGAIVVEKPDAECSPSRTSNVIVTKLLRSTSNRTDIPLWDLMMKNIYAVGAVQVKKEDFKLDLYYNIPGQGERRFLTESNLAGKPLLEVFNLDRLDRQNDPNPDGIFDFVEGITINSRTGRIMFPVLEPFGSSLKKKITDPKLAEQYTNQKIYTTTLINSDQYLENNRYVIKGTYSSSQSNEISLGSFNLPRGSVKVSAGGQPLVEGVDYTIDYGIGKVIITNTALLSSNVPVNVSFEDQSLFGFQQKTMIGHRFDYAVNKDFNIGATYMHLFERPYTFKVNVGEDPISNRTFGLDINYSKDAPWITRLVDRLPIISTKAPSSISLVAEAAYMRPGHARGINQGDSGGIVYLDDFEGSTSGTDLRNIQQWVLASIPQNDKAGGGRFPESKLINSTLSGVNRARLNWYIVAEGGNGSVRTDSDLSDAYTQAIPLQNIFPNRGNSFLAANSSARLFDMTYVPDERGQYNFDLPQGTPYSKGLNKDGKLNAPRSRWGGIMRAMPNPDFEQNNYEFIDMWVLSPFINSGSGTNDQGDLYFELGNISEDILRDSRLSNEADLPSDVAGCSTPTERTNWARVPNGLAIVPAFGSDPTKRTLQDVGLDGVNNEEEKQQYAAYIAACEAAQSKGALDNVFVDEVKRDPSNDDFKYILDQSYVTGKDGVIARYRNFNNLEGNSKESSQGTNNPDGINSSTNIPDTEDIIKNNSLDNDGGEAYYRYHIPLIPDGNGGIKPNQFIVDELPVDLAGGVRAKFYRIKVPLDQFSEKVGNLNDFRSIQMMRMYMTNFSKQTTLRFAKFELTRNQWRRYKRGFDDVVVDGNQTTFDVNAVNIEENGAEKANTFAYVLPPGLSREEIIGSPVQNQFQNEQSIALEACGLAENDRRGIFKILNQDMRQFKHIKMFVHAESADKTRPIKDKSSSVFLRLGKDFEENYYEYELPLQPSEFENLPAPGSLDPVGYANAYANEVWRPENNMDLDLDALIRLKEERNQKGFPISKPYSKIDNTSLKSRGILRIKGNPDLGFVKGIMIGVHNTDPDGNTVCTKVWVNELRVNGLDERGGSAALGRVDVKLADLGRVTVAGKYNSIGWGSLEDKLAQRARESTLNYGFTGSIELGKFLGEKAKIRIPLTYQYDNTIKTPEYDPYALDIRLKDRVSKAPASEQQAIQDQAIAVVTKRSFVLDNVRKDRGDSDKKPMPWNIENFSVSYRHNQDENHDPLVVLGQNNYYNGQLDYSFATGKSLTVQPFKKLFKKDKYVQFLSEFNFNPVPNSFSFNTNMDRYYNSIKYRFVDENALPGEPKPQDTYFSRKFTWDRKYDLNWELAKSLKLTFNSETTRLVDELRGADKNDPAAKAFLLANLKSGGRPKAYKHAANLSYTVPLKYFPLLDFATVKAQYQTTYNWDAAPLGYDSLGNTIRNTQIRTLNGDFNFETLYNKWKYLKKINSPIPVAKAKAKKAKPTTGGGAIDGNEKSGNMPTSKDKGREEDKITATEETRRNPADNPRIPKEMRDRMADKMKEAPRPAPMPNKEGDKTTEPDTKATGVVADGTKKEGELKKDDKPMTKEEKAKADEIAKATEKATKALKKKEKAKEEYQPSMTERILIRPLMSVRKARFSYTETFQNTVPGFMPQAKLFGQQEFAAPGWNFVFGDVPTRSYLDKAASNNWISRSPNMNGDVIRNDRQEIKANVTIEPFSDFRIEVSADRSYMDNNVETFKRTGYNAANFSHSALNEIKSFQTSYMALNTMFNNDLNSLFSSFENNRSIISGRLAEPTVGSHETDPGYKAGYGKKQKEVTQSAFLSTYSGLDPNTIPLDVSKTIPRPNWQLTYNGLTKLPFFKERFQSINITHGYKSTLQMNNIVSNATYLKDPAKLTEENNYYARYNVQDVSINESFSPLLGVQIKTKTDLSLTIDVKKSRTLGFTAQDDNLKATQRTDVTVGFGYKMKNVYIKFLDFQDPNVAAKKKEEAKKEKEAAAKEKPKVDKDGKPLKKEVAKKKKKGNDLNLKFDLTYSDDDTKTYVLDAIRTPNSERGQTAFKMSPSAEYKINSKLSLRAFLDYNLTIPKSSISFRQSSFNTGVMVRFNLSDK
jgi:cell surface protein SprA